MTSFAFEINPYASLAWNVKLEAASVSVGRRHGAPHRRVRRVHASEVPGLRELHRVNRRPRPPEGFRGQVSSCSALKVETRVPNNDGFHRKNCAIHCLADIFRVALGSVIRSRVSNYSCGTEPDAGV